MTYVYLVLISLLGVIAHWLKAWLRGAITSSLYWYMVEAPKNTGAMLYTLTASLLTSHFTGVITGFDEQSIVICFLAGFTADSTINKEA